MKNILVCVTKQNTIKHLLEKAVHIKEKVDGELSVLHVTKGKIPDSANEIECLYDICKHYDANLGVVYSDNVVKAIAKYVQENNIDKVILGETRQTNIRKSTMFKLQSALSGLVDIAIVPIKEEYQYKDVM